MQFQLEEGLSALSHEALTERPKLKEIVARTYELGIAM